MTNRMLNVWYDNGVYTIAHGDRIEQVDNYTEAKAIVEDIMKGMEDDS